MHPEALAPSTLRVLRAFADTVITRQFSLGGGTGLALHLGHRLSVDLDWFTAETFDPLVMCLEFPPGLPFEVTGTAANTLQARVDGVKVDCLRYAYPLLEPVIRWENVPLLSIPDIAAMKLSAAANRGAKKDFFDIAQLLETHPLPQLLEWYRRKFPAFQTLHIIRSLTWFEDAEAEPEPQVLWPLDWHDVKSRLFSAVAAL